MSFQQKRVLLNKLIESQFEVMYIYEFQRKANSHEDISWVSVWSYLSLRVTTKTEFLYRHLLSLSLKLCKFLSFKQKQIRMKTFVESEFQIMSVYEFQTKVNYYEDNCLASVWSYVSFWVSNKIELLQRHLLRLCLKLFKFTGFNQNRIIMKTFVQYEFEVM